MEPSHIIITGSDDILSVDFVSKAISNSCDIYALNHWYITDNTTLWLFKYLAAQPLGGGRCYSRKFLEGIDYKIFDEGRNKLLDDNGWIRARGRDIVISNEPDILAVKGNWPVMNPLATTMNHPNAKLLATYECDEAKRIMKEKFNYEVS